MNNRTETQNNWSWCRQGDRHVSHEMLVEHIGNGRWALRWRDARGQRQFATGHWSTSRVEAQRAAESLVRRGLVAVIVG